MSKLDQESLFSLEVVVDKIHLSPKVSCRFPAVAFRLLDFPTLMIYHVEPQLAEAIKRNIKKDPYYQLPLQLPELQDRDSSYQVKKGKSCLMKVSPNVLLSHLQNTPLYIMIIDTYPEVPKLVGNCAVPINVVMEDVYNDINELGISVPNSHGDKGVFVISNLMGDEIGKITLGYRLLSLGIGLIPHIPNKSIAKMGQGNISHPKIEKRVAAEVARIPKPMEQEAADIILEDLEAIDKNIQVVMSTTPAPAKEMTATQTQVESSRVAFTQTDYKKKKKKVKVEKKVDHPMTHFDPDLDDLFIVNVNTPPPLFYNSKADPPHVAPGLTFEDYLVHKHREVHLDEMSVSSADSDSTIRHEDKFSDSEMEIPKPKPQPEPSVVKKQVKKATQAKTISPNTNILGALSQFPLLSAIMSEIASLQGVGPSVKNEVGLPPHRTSSPHRNAITPRELPSSPRFKPVTPRPSNLSQRSSPVRQPPPPKALVKQKSWLKTEKKQPKKQGTTPQPMVVAKTKITPGMTNTQRLRLAMTNPQLLQKLEKEERERVEKFKAKRKELGEGLDFVPSQRDVYTEAKTRSADGSNDVHLHFDHHKRPIPTPRMSLSHDLEHITVSEVPHITPRISKLKGQSDPQATIVKQYPQVQARSLQKTEIITAAKKKSVPVVKVDADDLQYTDSEEAISQVSRIDVHMPVISLHEDDAGSDPGDTTDQDDVSYDADQVPDLVARPSFPKSRSRLDSANSNDLSQHYSDDFEDSHAYQDRLEDDDLNAVADLDEDHRSEGGLELSGGEGVDPAELLGLRKMVDAYSDTEEEEEEEQAVPEPQKGVDVGELLGLRKMVDAYSDDESHGSHNAQPQGVEIQGLREVEDKYSDDESSKRSFKSFPSTQSDASDPTDGPTKPSKLRLQTSSVVTGAPSASDNSPVVAATRQPPMALRSGLTMDAADGGVDTVSSYEGSTAYIARSDMPSQFSSMESTIADFQQYRPLPSPRKSLDRNNSSRANADELYDDYSENFESVAESLSETENVKQMKDAGLAAAAKFGYTWGYSR